jgi:hypothetical protein
VFGVWAAIPFVTSLIILGGFLGFRVWEEKQGRRLFAAAREKADEKVEAFYTGMVTGNIPTHWRQAAIVLLKKLTHALVVLLAKGLGNIQRSLFQLSHRLRRGVPSANGKSPSEFLKTISPQKKEEPSESKPDSVS